MKGLSSADLKKIDDIIKLGVPLTITTYSYSHDVQAKMDEFVTYFLQQIHQPHLKEYAVYCLNELAVNAKKANTKRVYFNELGLDIFNSAQYKIGIEKFKTETLENIDYYIDLQKKAGLYIKIGIKVNEQNFEIEVRNNSVMTWEEQSRANEKIAMAAKIDNIAEAMEFMDETEGAGLGLVIMMIMLKQIGATTKAYSISVIKDETVAKIRLPFSANYVQAVPEVSAAVIRQINQIPQFPENILELQKLINDPDVAIPDIAKKISGDLGITADLLKLVNSVAFGLKAKCSSIAEAVKLVGIRGIQNLLYSIGTMNVFADTHSSTEQQMLWQHSYKVAYFSYNLARVLRMQSILDDSYVCGLLHDIGKLVFSGLYPDVLNAVNRIQIERNIPQEIIATITSGIHHAEIGARLTEKWDFPKQITASIRFHHRIEEVPKQYFEITAAVALANFMVHYSEGNLTFDQIPQPILQAFNVKDEGVIKKLSDNFSKGFENT